MVTNLCLSLPVKQGFYKKTQTFVCFIEYICIFASLLNQKHNPTEVELVNLE